MNNFGVSLNVLNQKIIVSYIIYLFFVMRRNLTSILNQIVSYVLVLFQYISWIFLIMFLYPELKWPYIIFKFCLSSTEDANCSYVLNNSKRFVYPFFDLQKLNALKFNTLRMPLSRIIGL